MLKGGFETQIQYFFFKPMKNVRPGSLISHKIDIYGFKFLNFYFRILKGQF